MKKFCGIMLCLLAPCLITATAQEATTYLQCDFDNGIPEDFACYDQDGHTLHFSMVQAGFEQGDAWISKREPLTQPANYFAASASKYKWAAGEAAQPSDDWLVTPRIYIRAADATLSWRGCSFCETSPKADTYQIMVSVGGNRPEDFRELPLATIEAESVNQWTQHELALGEYAGQDIYIAFVNRTTNGEILGIDDVKVEGGKGLYDFVAVTPAYIYGQQEFAFEGSIGAFSDEPITHFTAHLRHNGRTISKSFEGLNIRRGATFNFTLDEALPAACGDTVRYAAWVEVNGNRATDTLQLRTVSMLFNPTRRIVVEEGTGMWCAYCPKGIVAMQQLKEKYPDTFVGIALHYDDFLEADDYVRRLQFPGFPTAYVNRQYPVVDPMVPIVENGQSTYTTLNGGLETWFLQAAAQQAIANIDIEAGTPANGSLELNAHATFALPFSKADFAIAFVLTEDEVGHEAFYQTNAYSGGNEVMGGYEALPYRISPFTFDEVARGIYPNWQGAPGSLPETIEAGRTYSYNLSLNLPATIANVENLWATALLIDRHTGCIANAATIQPGGKVQGILHPATAASSLTYNRGTRSVMLQTPHDEEVVCSIHASCGTLLHQEVLQPAGGVAAMQMPQLPQGIYIVTACQPSSSCTIKVSVP